MSSSLVLSELIEDKEEIENNITMIIRNIININNNHNNNNNNNDNFNIKFGYYMKIEINKRKLFMINEKINNYKK
jgi:hypothetical protein